jgi:molecular chaperone GrpE
VERLRRLVRGAAEPPAFAAADGVVQLGERLARIERALADLAQAVSARPEVPPEPPGLGAIEQGLAALEKQITRAGREQLKTNTLVETQIEQQRAALEALRAADERREGEATALRDQLRTVQQTARLEMVRAILPALDGLDEALRSGTQLLEQAAPQRRRLLSRLRGHAPPSPAEQTLRESMQAWLDGLQFVRQRLLEVLAAEGVLPMDADGQPFDPRRHIALDVVPARDRPLGTVVSTLRQGYVAGDRILRHADVAVAGDSGQHDAPRRTTKGT